MQIRRIVLKNARNFIDLDRTFEDDWSGNIPKSLLLIGPNGSGKTTLLSVIVELWQAMADYLQDCEDTRATRKIASSQAIYASDLAAVEIVGLESEPIWIYHGEKKTCREFVGKQEGSHRIGMCYDAGFSYGESVEYEGYLGPSTGWQRQWAERLTENILGKRADLPNVVYLESETRVLLPVEEKFSVQPEPEEFHWLARYAPTTARKGSLHNYLYNLKVVDETVFQEIVDQVNTFLTGKRLAGFNRRGDLAVQVDDGGSHSIDDFSSGEKQVLLMIATITRWLRSGGVVLIDEPDLHLHPSLTTAFVSHLRRMVADKGGQLIIASHAPELWREFTPSHRVELGSTGEVRG